MLSKPLLPSTHIVGRMDLSPTHRIQALLALVDIPRMTLLQPWQTIKVKEGNCPSGKEVTSWAHESLVGQLQ